MMNIKASDEEVILMADVLRRRFAESAYRVAENFASEHRLIGDTERADQWERVGAELRDKRTFS